MQKAYLEKKISRKKNICSYSSFSPILNNDILFILEIFLSFQKWILIKSHDEAVRNPAT